MRTYNIHEAKTNLSRLMDEVENGEPFTSPRPGSPWPRCFRSRASKKKPQKRIGFMKGMYTLPDNFKDD